MLFFGAVPYREKEHISKIPRKSGAKKAHKHKETQLTSPISDPTPKFFMWGSLLLENKGEGATHMKNLGLHWGPLHSLCGYFFRCFFCFLENPRTIPCKACFIYVFVLCRVFLSLPASTIWRHGHPQSEGLSKNFASKKAWCDFLESSVADDRQSHDAGAEQLQR